MVLIRNVNNAPSLPLLSTLILLMLYFLIMLSTLQSFENVCGAFPLLNFGRRSWSGIQSLYCLKWLAPMQSLLILLINLQILPMFHTWLWDQVFQVVNSQSMNLIYRNHVNPIPRQRVTGLIRLPGFQLKLSSFVRKLPSPVVRGLVSHRTHLLFRLARLLSL